MVRCGSQGRLSGFPSDNRRWTKNSFCAFCFDKAKAMASGQPDQVFSGMKANEKKVKLERKTQTR